MTKTRSYQLYVNLSASQARKRLKGHGFGVRKIESVGRNQAVIHHTATGGHLRELKSLLADLKCSASAEGLDIPVANLKNLGRTSAQWLRQIGIHTRADLKRLGPVLAYRRVKQQHPSASLNLLWAMVAALADRDWRQLSDEEKGRLRAEVEQ